MLSLFSASYASSPSILASLSLLPSIVIAQWTTRQRKWSQPFYVLLDLKLEWKPSKSSYNRGNHGGNLGVETPFPLPQVTFHYFFHLAMAAIAVIHMPTEIPSVAAFLIEKGCMYVSLKPTHLQFCIEHPRGVVQEPLRV